MAANVSVRLNIFAYISWHTKRFTTQYILIWGLESLRIKIVMPLWSIYQLFHVINYISMLLLMVVLATSARHTYNTHGLRTIIQNPKRFERINGGENGLFFMSYTSEGGCTPFVTQFQVTYVTWELIPLNLASQRSCPLMDDLTVQIQTVYIVVRFLSSITIH